MRVMHTNGALLCSVTTELLIANDKGLTLDTVLSARVRNREWNL